MMTLKTTTTSGTGAGVFGPFFFSLMRNDVAALRLATCVFPLEKKESSLSFEPFFKDISFKSLFFLHQHGC